ncbi:SoxR reducing system RseC family protein [Candidatus Regiella insecticola]|uniref:SoxR reducing system RseC family protein n=1 Tax=Candidatus Regiella insecticola TaxID=138073 RepID=UPI00159E07FD|nr:SoxR reducing system RseC family protein [Candidatus Regiella insecticola]
MVYFLPLLGLISSSFFCQMLFDKEAITVIGGLMGGIYGFIIARMAAAKIATKDTYQPVVFSVTKRETP